ncbi:MAG: hypothetical protein ACTS5Y_02030 [Pollutimonas bauzanensis]
MRLVLVAMVCATLPLPLAGHAASTQAELAKMLKEQQRALLQEQAQALRDARNEAARVQREQQQEKARADREARQREAQIKRDAQQKEAQIKRADQQKEAQAKRAAEQQANRELQAQRQKEHQARQAALAQRRIDERRKACEPAEAWLEDGPVASVLGADGRVSAAAQEAAAVALLSHGRFERAFGRTYESMTQEEIFALGRQVGSCFGQPDGPLVRLSLAQKMAASAALNGYRQQLYLQGLERVRAAQETLGSVAQQLDALAPDKAGYDKLGQLESRGLALLSLGSAPAVERFKEALAGADARVALPVEQELVRQAISAADGVQGLLALDALRASMYRQPSLAGADPGAKAARHAHAEAITVRIDELAAGIADIERQRIDALGSGLTGLERGLQWQADYKARLAHLSGRVKALADLPRYFRERRLALLEAGGPALARAVADSKDEQDLQALQARYLLAGDETTVPGTRILTAVADQRRELEKRAALGRRPQEDRAELASGGPAPASLAAGASAAAPAGDAVAPGTSGASSASGASGASGAGVSSPGEPSEETMYDLIRTVLDQGARKQAEMLSQCQGDGLRPGDPAMNYVCAIVLLGKGIQSGTLAPDKPARILKFEKLGCAPAMGKAGYICDYELAVEKNLNPALVGPQAKRLLEGPSAKQARFLQGRDGWRIFYTEDAVR